MRIDLRLSQSLRVLGVLFVAFSLLLATVSITIIIHAAISGGLFKKPIDLASGAFGFLFFGLAALVGIRRLSRTPGAIEIRPNGVLLSCYSIGPFSGLLGGYLAWGFADWSNLSATGLVKAQGRTCLGVRLRDVDAFIATRETLGEKDHVHADRLGLQSGRIVRALTSLMPIGKFLELYMILLGFTGMAKSAEEKDVLAWNQDNYGWTLLIPDLLIPDGPEALHQLIDQQRPRQ